MIVDDEDTGQSTSRSSSIPDTGGTLFLGKDNFKGCISNLYTRRWDGYSHCCARGNRIDFILIPGIRQFPHLECKVTLACRHYRPSNMFKAEDLSNFQTSGDVLLDVCAANSPAQLMLDRNVKKVSVCSAGQHLLNVCLRCAMIQFQVCLTCTGCCRHLSLIFAVVCFQKHRKHHKWWRTDDCGCQPAIFLDNIGLFTVVSWNSYF